MNVLAIDTSSAACSVMLRSGNGSFFRCEDAERQHSRYILVLIESVLEQAGIGIESVGLVAWNAGPGSFTGLRIGASVIQALTYAACIPVLALSSLEIIAHAVYTKLFSETFSCAQIAVALDARMNGVYWATFACYQGRLDQIDADALISVEDALGRRVAGQEYLCAGDAWLTTSLANLDEDVIVSGISARDVMALALAKKELPDHPDVSACMPRYIRDATQWQKRKPRVLC
jgi:tRNA threonylcarbamoyladenosine biosynthesis protein TsaB